MPKAVLATALLLILLAAAVYAQQQRGGDIFNTERAREAVEGGVGNVRLGLQLGFLTSIGLVMFSVFKNIVLEQSGIPGVFRDKLFWIPFSLFAILLGFWVVAQFSAPVGEIYKQLVGDNCPLYWCP
jgi:hypothetical protein